MALTVQTIVKAGIQKCWEIWTNPADILQFNNPFEHWHTAKVETDLKAGGRLYYRMESIDGSDGFDFAGTYNSIILYERIESTGDDGRKTIITFTASGDTTIVAEIFEPDTNTALDLQMRFCQGILDSFKKHVEK